MEKIYGFENVDINTLPSEAKEIIREYREEAEKVNKPFSSFIENETLYALKWLDWSTKLSPLFAPVWNLKESRKYTIEDLNKEETAPKKVFEMQKLISNVIL